jgi:hypothetical protein
MMQIIIVPHVLQDHKKGNSIDMTDIRNLI